MSYLAGGCFNEPFTVGVVLVSVLIIARWLDCSWRRRQPQGLFSTRICVHNNKNVKVKADIALHGNPVSDLRDFTCHMGSHRLTCHPTQVNATRLTPAIHAGTRFTYPAGMEGWVDLVDLIGPRPGVEPATFRPRVRPRTAAPPRQPNTLRWLLITATVTETLLRYKHVTSVTVKLCYA